MLMSFKTLNPIPESLLKLRKKVEKLYYIGDTNFLQKPIVAIVGSRRPNPYTKRLVTMLSSSLKKRDVYVISGAAMGVDAVAHLGAFPKTIAVMGNSLDIIYPKVNCKLIKNMEEQSLILSEYDKNTKPTPWSFVDRNRIVIALSQAVVIAQADEKSGSMHSAKIAQKLNKPLYVLPQRLEDSVGTNLLLSSKKAELISNIDSFCDKFGEVTTLHDEILEYCKQNPSLEDAIKKYKDKIYEYELEGKIDINGVNIRVL